MGSGEAESWHRCRSSRVEELGEAVPVLCGRDARAPGWASSRDVVAAIEALSAWFSFLAVYLSIQPGDLEVQRLKLFLQLLALAVGLEAGAVIVE